MHSCISFEIMFRKSEGLPQANLLNWLVLNIRVSFDINITILNKLNDLNQ